MGRTKPRESIIEVLTQPKPRAGPGLRSIAPPVAEARESRAAAIATATCAITEALDKLPSDSTRMRAFAAVAVAQELDPDALFFLDQAHGWDCGRCARCGRTWRGARWNE